MPCPAIKARSLPAAWRAAAPRVILCAGLLLSLDADFQPAAPTAGARGCGSFVGLPVPRTLKRDLLAAAFKKGALLAMWTAHLWRVQAKARRSLGGRPTVSSSILTSLFRGERAGWLTRGGRHGPLGRPGLGATRAGVPPPSLCVRRGADEHVEMNGVGHVASGAWWFNAAAASVPGAHEAGLAVCVACALPCVPCPQFAFAAALPYLSACLVLCPSLTTSRASLALLLEPSGGAVPPAACHALNPQHSTVTLAGTLH